MQIYPLRNQGLNKPSLPPEQEVAGSNPAGRTNSPFKSACHPVCPAPERLRLPPAEADSAHQLSTSCGVNPTPQSSLLLPERAKLRKEATNEGIAETGQYVEWLEFHLLSCRRALEEPCGKAGSMNDPDAEARNATARASGYKHGLDNRHYTRDNYWTGNEWRAWLEGWRAGYAAYIERRRLHYLKKGLVVSLEFLKLPNRRRAYRSTGDRILRHQSRQHEEGVPTDRTPVTPSSAY